MSTVDHLNPDQAVKRIRFVQTLLNLKPDLVDERLYAQVDI